MWGSTKTKSEADVTEEIWRPHKPILTGRLIEVDESIDGDTSQEEDAESHVVRVLDLNGRKARDESLGRRYPVPEIPDSQPAYRTSSYTAWLLRTLG